MYRTIYIYDAENTCTLMVYGADDGLVEKVVCTDDSEGKPVQRINYYPDGSLKTRGTREMSNEGAVIWRWFSYDPDGLATGSRTETDNLSLSELQKCYYGGDGSLISKSLSYYDSERHEMERRNYDHKDALEKRLTWNYDPAGNMTKTMEYLAQDEIEEERFFVYEYDEVGNWTTRTFLILVLGSEPPRIQTWSFHIPNHLLLA